MLTFSTAGESHGQAIVAIIEGFPAGVRADLKLVNAELARRQGGHGRGGRMKIETDQVQVLAGLRRGLTLGSPVVLSIPNRDVRLDDLKRTPGLFRPRPGHGDLAGALKYLNADMRNILERASARETAGRVAAGAFVRSLLQEFGIELFAHVTAIGEVTTAVRPGATADELHDPAVLRQLRAARRRSPLYSLDRQADAAMIAAIDQARQAGDTLGGLFEVLAVNVPPGLGSHVSVERRLDARLAAALMGIQAIKGVEIGLGFEAARRPGSRVHDAIGYEARQWKATTLGYLRTTNNAGGLEAGITNGQPLVLRAAMKPIATLGRPLPSIDIRTKRTAAAGHERSDVCAVPAASVVGENVVAFELARALLEKTGGDSLAEVRANFASFLKLAREI